MAINDDLAIILASIVASGVTFYLIPLLSAVAFKFNILDNPDGRLKNHKQPTPYLGGLAVYIGFITALALFSPLENSSFVFVLGSTLLLFVGLIDDLIAMKPLQKFIGQILATACFLKGGFYFKETFLMSFDQTLVQAWWLFVSFWWILSVINAFNLVDIMDGLASVIALGAVSNFLVIALLTKNFSAALLLGTLAGSLSAFLWFNYPPAKIYLGDAGSLFVGGCLATVPFMMSWGTYTSYGFIAPVIILLIPLLEVGTLIIVRTYKKIPFYNGSPDHFALYLRGHGWSRPAILGYVITCSLALGVISTLFFFNCINFLTTLGLVILFVFFWYFLLFFGAKRLFCCFLFFK